jgi:hypothetical protein
MSSIPSAAFITVLPATSPDAVMRRGPILAAVSAPFEKSMASLNQFVAI